MTNLTYIKRISLNYQEFSLSDKIYFEEAVEASTKDTEKFNKAVYHAIYLYAVVVSRLNLASPGWVIHYEFEITHLKNLIMQIKGIIDYYGYLNY